MNAFCFLGSSVGIVVFSQIKNSNPINVNYQPDKTLLVWSQNRYEVFFSIYVVKMKIFPLQSILHPFSHLFASTIDVWYSWKESVISQLVWNFVMTHYLLKGGFLSSPVTPHFNNGSKLPRSTQWCVLNRINSVEINTQGFSTFSSLICAQVIFTWTQLVKVQEFICENIKIRVFYCCIDDDDVRTYVR